MSWLEAAMMLGFGLAWPFNIYKSIASKTAQGKSLAFLLTIEAAYLCGVLHKVIYSFDIVIWLYILNAAMVGADLFLFFKNRQRDRQKAASQETPS